MLVKGLYTAIITPFSGEEIDWDGLESNIEFQIENGVDGLVILGTTGETPTLTNSEKEEIITKSISIINNRVKVIIGTGTNNTKTTIENTQMAEKYGADGALIVTPYYNKPSQKGIYEHFKKIIENTDIPIIVYNIEGRTGRNIDVNTLIKISELDNIVGVKEASGNINQMGDVINEISRLNPDFSVMSGDDGLTLPLMSMGGHGVISVVSNLVPAEMKSLVLYAEAGNFEKARNIHYRLLPLFKGAFIETNPQPIKCAMNLCNMAGGDLRLPLVDVSDETEEKLRVILESMEII
ncbi:MAG: 4-hydroxy-tetrahydrodipicolinate synthase [Candidatus Muirbacterium halophilum]|nr:4-hydroxy-tetrahydrodipicolinate synthase [Candidatus Muirbacterium halophilum]MCK9474495.1 4-hydroxy-tetrahydrodipicolinate synthase [Candidatus Muirbacterium halophilum]